MYEIIISNQCAERKAAKRNCFPGKIVVQLPGKNREDSRKNVRDGHIPGG